MQVNLNQIVASDKPIRTTWSEEEMVQLVDSIKQWGVIQPVKLRPLGDDPMMPLSDQQFEIVDGHRRVEASHRAGLEFIEASTEDMDDQTALIQSLIANVQREDNPPLDTANALQAIKDSTEWTDYTIAKKIGKSKNWVTRHLALLKETEQVQRLIDQSLTERPLTPEHINRTSYIISDIEDKMGVLNKAQSEELSPKLTRQVAEAVKMAGDLGDQRAKEALIAEPYSTLMHDPEIVRERHARFAKTTIPDPMYIRTDKERKSFAQQQQSEWDRLPEAQTVLNYINKWHNETVPKFIKAAVIGKLSPEGKQFLARRVARLSIQLTNWQHQLENEETNGR